MAFTWNWDNAGKVGTAENALVKLVQFHENNELYKNKASVSYSKPDIDGHTIIGYGSTLRRGMSVPMSEGEATKHLIVDLKEADSFIRSHNIFKEAAMERMTPNQYAAVVSIFHNISSNKGRANLTNSTFVREINEGKQPVDKILDTELPRWSKAGGSSPGGILKRRLNEAALAGHTGDLAGFTPKDIDNPEMKLAMAKARGEKPKATSGEQIAKSDHVPQVKRGTARVMLVAQVEDRPHVAREALKAEPLAKAKPHKIHKPERRRQDRQHHHLSDVPFKRNNHGRRADAGSDMQPSSAPIFSPPSA